MPGVLGAPLEGLCGWGRIGERRACQREIRRQRCVTLVQGTKAKTGFTRKCKLADSLGTVRFLRFLGKQICWWLTMRSVGPVCSWWGPSEMTVTLAYGFWENLKRGAVETTSGCACVPLPVSCGQLCLHLARCTPTPGEGLGLLVFARTLALTLRKTGVL